MRPAKHHALSRLLFFLSTVQRPRPVSPAMAPMQLVPTQQLILSTYIFLFLVAMVSITEFQIIMRHRKKQEAKVCVSTAMYCYPLVWNRPCQRAWAAPPPSWQPHACGPIMAARCSAAGPKHASAPPAQRLCMRSTLAACLQRHKDAYKRYCKLRDAGRLKGGQNPPLSAADSLIVKDQLQVVRIGNTAAPQQSADPEDVTFKSSKEVSIVLPKEQAEAMLGKSPFAGVPADECTSPTAAVAAANAAAASAAAAAAAEEQPAGCSGRLGFIPFRFWEVRPAAHAQLCPAAVHTLHVVHARQAVRQPYRPQQPSVGRRPGVSQWLLRTHNFFVPGCCWQRCRLNHARTMAVPDNFPRFGRHNPAAPPAPPPPPPGRPPCSAARSPPHSCARCAHCGV